LHDSENHDVYERLLETSFRAPRSLRPQEFERLKEHVRGCERCRELHERYATMEHGLHPGTTSLSAGQVERGLAALSARTPPRRRQPWLALTAATAAAAAGLFVAFPGPADVGDDDFVARSGAVIEDPRFGLRLLRVREEAIADAERAALAPGDAVAVMASAPPGVTSLELTVESSAGTTTRAPTADGEAFDGRRLAILSIESPDEVPRRVHLRFRLRDGAVVEREIELP